MLYFQLFIVLNCVLNLSLRCGPPLMIARFVALPQTPKINLSVSILIAENKIWKENYVALCVLRYKCSMI